MQMDLSRCSESWLEQMATSRGVPADVRSEANEELFRRNHNDLVLLGGGQDSPLLGPQDDLNDPSTLERVNRGLRALASAISVEMQATSVARLSDDQLRIGVEQMDGSVFASSRYTFGQACIVEIKQRNESRESASGVA